MEFLKLAQEIDPSFYYNVGISLGFSHAQLKAILIENLNNFKNAFMDVFMKWNVKQQPTHSNKRQLLADKLQEIDLGGLSNRLLNGPPIPNSTGGPSRMPESQTKPPSAESLTKPLSPELVEECARDFRFKYRSTLCKIRADPLKPSSHVGFEKLYTSLVLLEEDGTSKQTIDYDNFIDLKVNGEFPKRIMVQGEAGAGKTTFCAKIAWDWIEGRHYSHFVWVLVVPLREFKQHNIGEIAKSYLAQNNRATVSQITDYIRTNPDKVFIAFDGLDEVRGDIMKTKSHQSQPTDQIQLQPSHPSVISSEACGSSSGTGDIGLVDILCSDQLASCPVLVTTRPWRAVDIRRDGDLIKPYSFIHVNGFSRENLSVYIHKYFPKNSDKANQLIQFTNDNDVISENMAHYPIYVAMLCLMWKELDQQKLKEMKSLKTFSQIFKEMIAFLKEHYAQKEVKKIGSPSLLAYLKQIDELLGPIAKQALTGLLENTLIFSEDDFQICLESKDIACRVGILSQEERITADIDAHERNSHVQLPVFFPHKLFQEYMAGIHLAFLYESDRTEFNKLIEQVVLPSKEEFRYLLYFTVSQNKSIATHVMMSMLQGIDMNSGASDKQIHFIVDVAFESQNPDVADLVRDRVSTQATTLIISRGMRAHTVAGYAFIEPHVVELCIQRECGPTTSLDVAEMICSMPFLKIVSLEDNFHHFLFATLARKGKESKVQTLRLDDLMCTTQASSHHLVEALCSMPNLTDLTLGRNLTEEFYSILKAKASSIQVQTLMLDDHIRFHTQAKHHLLEAVCYMPNLTDLTLGRNFTEEFYSGLKAKASSIQVQTLKVHDSQYPSPASSHHLAEALCSMPNLTDLTLEMYLTEEFYSVLKAKALSIQVQTLKLKHIQYSLTQASAPHLVEALCSMPNLTDLTLRMDDIEEFYSILKAKASSIQVQTLKLENIQYSLTPASAPHLVEALCSMPNLTDLTLGMDYTEEFYSILKAKASSIQVQTLKLENIQYSLTPASAPHLVEALCSMPNLTDLTLGINYTEHFFPVLKAKASSIQVQTLKLHQVQYPSPALAHHLAEALCSMPNLADLTLDLKLNEVFISVFRAKVSSIQVQTLRLYDYLYECPTQAPSHHLAKAVCSLSNLTDLKLDMDITEEFFSVLKAKASSNQVYVY
eukprot:XP_011679607.1 PREDICTED: NACHT, LRR and PYD domains-containing protein 12-like [Strongylocentrotus purpuratus]